MVSVILQKRNKADKEGVLTIRIIKDRKKKDISLKIKINATYWNEDKQRVYANAKIDHKSINDTIENELKKYENQTIEIVKSEKKSFIKYFERINSNFLKENKIGSHKKLITVINNIKGYAKHIGKSDLLFEDFNHDMIVDIKGYFLNERNVSMNTANRLLIQIKTILNKAHKEDYYTYARSPFLNFETPKETKRDAELSQKEVLDLIAYIPSTNAIKWIKNKFLWQTFSQGQRVSDMLLMRFNNIYEDTTGMYRIKYVMYKTKQPTNILLNNNLIYLLGDIFLNDERFKRFEIEFNNSYTNLIFAESAINKHTKFIKGINEVRKAVKEKKKDDTKIVDEELNKLKANKKKFTLEVLKEVLKDDTLKNGFIWNLLDVELFKKFDVHKPSQKQFANIQARTATYNKQLKVLQKAVGLTNTLTSHKARYTFTNLMLLNGSDLYTISKSLNHSKLQITETYLTKFNVKMVDKANESMIDKYEI